MMLAAADPDDTGPIVINGAPMSYWGGAWQDGGGDNPMRYSGGMLGGTWLASLTSDLGDGVFDGAYLVENFENLNPANTFWDKYYHLYANVDTEPPRFLEFERWWGGFYLMNREEIEWITRNLFVGNKLWSGETKMKGGRRIRPAQHQGADHPVRVDGRQHHAAAAGVQLGRGRLRLDRRDQGARAGDRRPGARRRRPSRHLRLRQGREEGARADRVGAGVDRDAAAGAVRHEDRRSARARTARSEYDVSVSRSAGSRTSSRGSTSSSAATRSRSRRWRRSPSSTSAPTSSSCSRSCRRPPNEYTAKLRRQFHPLRFQRWAMSDLNPWLGWLGPAAQMRQGAAQAPSARTTPALKMEKAASAAISASLDYYRAMRDAASEAAFFLAYGNVFSLYIADKHAAEAKTAERIAEPRELPFVREALDVDRRGRLSRGACACRVPAGAQGRAAAAVAPADEAGADRRVPRPAAGDAVGPVAPHSRRAGDHRPLRARPALATLPALLANRADRERLVTLVRRLLADERVQRDEAVDRAARDDREHRRNAGRSPRRRHKRVARSAARQAHAERAAQARNAANGRNAMERTHEKYQRLLDFCKALPPTPTAVAHPCDESSLRGAVDAAQLGLIAPILVGPRARIEARGAAAQHRHREPADRRRAVQRGVGRQGRRARARGQGRGADEGQPAHRRADGRGRPARDGPAHGAARQPLLRDGRADPTPRR